MYPSLGNVHNGMKGARRATRASPRSLKSALPKTLRGRTSVIALGGAAGVDIVTTAATTELIAKTASHSLLSQPLNLQFDGHHGVAFLQTLHHALQDNNLFQSHDALTAAEAALQATSSGISQIDLSAASGLGSHASDMAQVAMAAGIASDAVASSSVGSLALWAADKLAVVQSIDAVAYESMKGSLLTLLDAVSASLEGQVSVQATHWTNALVLGVQQLVTALRMPAAGGASIEAMLAAQQAMSASLATTEVAATIPAGLDGLMKVVLAIVAMVVAAIPRDDWRQRAASAATSAANDKVPLRYNIPELQAYFSKRPAMVMQRNAQVVSQLSSFAVSVLADWKLGKWEANMPERAATIRKVMESLGPAYIKIGQALSTRSDVIPEVYLKELAKLQDNVKCFSTVEARKVLEEGLGRPVDSVFEWISAEPLAAASLGQVYRGKLREEHGGNEVAIKVQRPGVLESAALDIFVMRRTAVLFSQIPGMSDGWAQALDDWADRFFQEMDYQLEAHNTMTFKKQMASLEGIKVATVHPEFTSRKIIVSEWIEGERLSNVKTEDVKALCNTLLNCYLIQLLETGLLHADPHPGNLMRTADGKIVILDFGLMTEVSEDQRIALVEFIAHLTLEDWEGVAKDLVALGFMPDGVPPEAFSQIAPIMEMVMGQLVRGGGLKNGINIVALTSKLDGVARNYKLCIPPYFALVLRAFSTIEGIALTADPKYAIVQECLPYMSRRLLSDNNPRMRAALRQLLYGDSSRLNIERLQRMIRAFSNFTTAASQGEASNANGTPFTSGYSESVKGRPTSDGLLFGSDDGPIINDAMKDVLKVVFSKEGSYAQELIVDEAVAAIDAMSREAMGEALRLVLSSATTVAALRSMEALGPLRAMLLPLPLPTEMLYSLQPAVKLTAEDRQALGTIRALLDLLQPSLPGLAANSSRAIRVAGEVMPMLPELLPGMQTTVELFMRQLIRRMALRLAEDLEPGKLSGKPQASYSSMPQSGNKAPPKY